MASHLLYTQCLNDTDTDERSLGIQAGMRWRHVTKTTLVFVDCGISSGMKAGVEHARKNGYDVREISLQEQMGVEKFEQCLGLLMTKSGKPDPFSDESDLFSSDLRKLERSISSLPPRKEPPKPSADDNSPRHEPDPQIGSA
jgi:hypothetical protein